ncbi:DUF948 domain-containing protein [Paenibacillus sp. MBLB4367]|uniref:DUF948 domain-containing protein n=1 Tax=Paenibacillus sp. MBLB4367 TaxID=3384767 RepID=UPI0039083517
MLLQISAIMVAIAFVVLTFFLIQTLQSLKGSLDEITLAMGQMKNEVKEISEEVKDVIGNTNEMALDLRMKLSKLNHVFGSVNDVGQAVHEITSSVKQSAASLAASLKQTISGKTSSARTGRWHAVLDGIAAALDLWHKLRPMQTQTPRNGDAD